MRKLNTSLGLIFVTLLLASTSFARDETVPNGVEPQSQENDETRSLTEHTLAFEEMYLRTYFSMSMDKGKSKGKGGGKSKASGDAKIGSSKTGHSKAVKTSKASKSSKVNAKKSKKSKASGTIAPTVSSMPSTGKSLYRWTSVRLQMHPVLIPLLLLSSTTFSIFSFCCSSKQSCLPSAGPDTSTKH
jgi:hypothetical protein